VTQVTDTVAPAGDPVAAGEPKRPRRISRGTDLGERLALPFVWLVEIAVFGLLKPHEFLSVSNFATIFGTQTPIAILTLALVIPCTVGEYDLSSASILTLSAMVLTVLNVQHGWGILPAIAAALAAGVLVGVINGMIVTYFEIESLIVTLGTGTVVQGLVLWISSSTTISGVSTHLVNVVIGTSLLGIPLSFYYAIALAAVIWYVFEFTPLGRRLLFVGRGRDVARLSGIRVQRVRIGALATSGLVSAFAGVMYAGTTGSADPSSGLQFLLPAFAAAFLGATSIMPGRFNPWGSLIAVYFLVTGITGFQLLGVQPFVQDLFYGGALVFAVMLSQLARRRRAAAQVADVKSPSPRDET
jgi:ribose transport system permease protein